MSFNPSAPPVIINTGGVQFVAKCKSVPLPGEVVDTGDGGSGTGVGSAGADSYGVAKIFPDLPNPPAPPFYLDMNTQSNNSSRFNISYGTGSHITYTLQTDPTGGYKYYTTDGNKVTYASGSPSSQSMRADIYPAGGIWGNKTNYSWKSNPGYLYTAGSFLNHELTFYLRVHSRKNTHEAFAFKLQGRDEDNIRSVIEIVYPTHSHSDVVVNVNYEHEPYVSYNKVRQYTDTSSTTITPTDQWIGVKAVIILADDQKSSWLGMYEDIDPIDSQGRPKNNWKLRADCIFTGVSDYKNVIPTWKCHKNVVRVDGWDHFDFMYVSDREIDKSALKNPATLKPTTGFSYGAVPQFSPSQFDGDSQSN